MTELKKLEKIEQVLINTMQMEKRVPKGFFKNKLKEEIINPVNYVLQFYRNANFGTIEKICKPTPPVRLL